MRWKAIIAAAILGGALAGLSACATSTVYGPAQTARGDGFIEQQIEANRYMLTVRGNFVTSRDRVEQMMLFRAAELTLNNGFDYFVLAERKTDASRRLDPVGGPRLGFGWSWYSSRWGWRWWDDPIWADPPSYREVSRFEASADVAMFRGAKPEGNANAYDARAIKENLAAVAAPPPQR
jgi:hypothetical protein